MIMMMALLLLLLLLLVNIVVLEFYCRALILRGKTENLTKKEGPL